MLSTQSRFLAFLMLISLSPLNSSLQAGPEAAQQIIEGPAPQQDKDGAKKGEEEEEVKLTTLEDLIRTELESLQMAKNAKDYKDMLKSYDELLREMPFAVYKEKMVFPWAF